MKVVVQKVLNASVVVNKEEVGKINSGLLIFVGFTHNDNISNIKYIVNKIVNLRIFEDNNNVMNLSAKELNKELLVVSQFTLYADTSKGNRPSYINSLKHEEASVLYDLFVEELKKSNLKVETGIFRSDMKVNLINDGPTTIIIEK
ncbi:d-tyrosyl-tRNA(Tyr) deacylase [Mycoplasma sp. CAG:611]|jgi:D-tyrosyl-tRNA(Tyr) deacylase|nr:d-tyrosyl-tRNA(Tyr) deacylase [Mycoplasma sp. CAG:611]